MGGEREYSHINLGGYALTGFVGGAIIGTLEGAVGSMAVPSSIRNINDNLEGNTNTIFHGRGLTVPQRVGLFEFYSIRLITRLGIHGTAMYKMIEDIVNGGDISYGLLAIPNLISAGYEAHRIWKARRMESQQPLNNPI